MGSNKLNFFFYSAGIIISGALSFLFIPVVVQLYGKAVYGSFTILFNLLSIVCMLCYAWVGQGFIRFYNAEHPQLFTICKKLLAKSLALGGLFFAVLITITTKVSVLTFVLLLATFFLFGYYCFLLLVFQALKKAIVIMLCEVVRTGVNVLVAVLFVKYSSAQYAIECLVLAMFIAYLIPTLTLHYKSQYLNIKKNNSTLLVNGKQLLNFGIPIALFLSGSLALSVNDRFLIAYLINKETAGTYAAIYDVINKGVIAVFSPILMTFYPEIAQLYNKGHQEQAFKKIKKLIWFEVLLIVLGGIFLFFFNGLLRAIIFNNNFSTDDFSFVTILVFFGVCLWQLAMLFHKPLELKQQTKKMAYAVLISLIFNVGLNYFFILKIQGLMAPALITVLSSIVYILLVLEYKKKIK